MPTAETISSVAKEPAASPTDAAQRAPAPPQRQARKRKTRVLTALVAILALAGGGGWYWWQQYLHALPAWIASANGRLEAEQVEIATKYPLRIASVFGKEGDMVEKGQILARMDTTEIDAQLSAATAQVRRAEYQEVEAEALIAQRDSERIFARQELQRTMILNQKGWATNELLDQRRKEIRTADAAYNTAVAGLDAARAMIVSWKGEAARLQSEIDDSTLVSPVRGRIQYKLAQPGEVLAAGGRVFTLLDLGDVYLTIFVPSRVAAALTVNDDARVVFDFLPDFVFPAKITFVATEAQFTPKMVETAEEREKLMFRVKLSAEPGVLERYWDKVKTGVRGIGYVRTDRNRNWPDSLAVKLP